MRKNNLIIVSFVFSLAAIVVASIALFSTSGVVTNTRQPSQSVLSDTDEAEAEVNLSATRLKVKTALNNLRSKMLNGENTEPAADEVRDLRTRLSEAYENTSA